MTSAPIELQGLVRQLVDSWNDRDEEAFAALFMPSAEYVTGEGERRRGRREIARLLRESQAGLHVVVSEAAADGDTRGGTVWFRWTAARRGATARQGRITCVVARHDGRWLIETLRNEEDVPAGEERP